MSRLNEEEAKLLTRFNVYQLRKRVSDLTRKDFGDKLEELERHLIEAHNALDAKKQTAPKTVFWRYGIVVGEYLNRYNIPNRNESLGLIWQILKCHLDESDPSSKVFAKTASGKRPCFDICTFNLDDAPPKVLALLKHAFTDVVKIRFVVTAKQTSAERNEFTDLAELNTARMELSTIIEEYEKMRLKLLELAKPAIPEMRALLKGDIETHADDSESDDSDDEDEESECNSKRQKTKQCDPKEDIMKILTGFEKEVRPNLGTLETLRANNFYTREGKEGQHELSYHAVHVIGSAYCLSESYDNLLPNPKAPCFSAGAEVDPRTGKLLDTGDEEGDLYANTIVTLAMKEFLPSMIGRYEEMQKLQIELKNIVRKVQRILLKHTNFVIEVYKSSHVEPMCIQQLSVFQQIAISELYLHMISMPVEDGKDEGEEEEEESDDEEEDSDDEEEDSDEDYAESDED
jgi:hypothetical protein